MAARFANINEILAKDLGKFLLEVDRLKSRGRLSDAEILITAYKKILESNSSLSSTNEIKT